MVTHSGHGSVSALKLDTTQAKAVSPQCARVMIRRITGSAALGKDQLDTSATCPQCDHPAGSPESLERHSVRCPNGGQRHYMHAAGLVAVIVAILLMAGIPKSSIVMQRKGLRPDCSRPGDVVVLDFCGLGRHLAIDAVISTVYRNTILSATSLIPGHVARSWLRTRSLRLMRCRRRSLSPASMEAITVFSFPTLLRRMVAHWAPMHMRS